MNGIIFKNQTTIMNNNREIHIKPQSDSTDRRADGQAELSI